MKYIGIGMMWFGYAGVVAALAFAPKLPGWGVILAIMVVGVSVAIASVRVARCGSDREG